MTTYYKAKIKFETEEFLNDADEFIPTYTAYLNGVEYSKEEGIDVEIDYIVDENDKEIPIKNFKMKTINYIYDKSFMADWDKFEQEYDYDLD
jgi:hypothetical protein